MDNLNTFTSVASEAVEVTGEVLKVSRYASTVEAIKDFAGEHPVATCVVAGVAAAGVSYVAYKGLCKLFKSDSNGGNENE